MTKQEIKDKIILHCKGLLSKNDKIYYVSINFLIGKFFDADNDFDIDDMDLLDQYQIIQAIFLSLMKGLLEENDFENLATIRDIYKTLQVQVLNCMTDEYDLDCYNLSNDFFNTKLHEIINKNK